MGQIIDLAVEKDHIESLTKANGVSALAELIWNSLDADASEIKIEYSKNAIGNYEYIKIIDNGLGLTFDKAQVVFGKIGGSEKTTSNQSPLGRVYHGKEGKGRYKSLSLGDLVEFSSIYKSNGGYSTFISKIDNNKLLHTEISDLKQLKKGEGEQGFCVSIYNINNKNAEFALRHQSRKEFEEKFASYWISYPTFKIFFNGDELKFDTLIKNTVSKDIKYEIDGLTYAFTFKVIEWNFDNNKKTYLCNSKGIPYLETTLGIHSSLPISIFIQSIYIEELHRKNTLQINEAGKDFNIILKDARTFARDYIRERLSFYSKDFIDGLKTKNIYPYKDKSDDIVEESKRQVFDIVALHLHEYLPSFDDQDDKGKKLTLSLIKEALESDSTNLRKILSDVIELPEDKREELFDLLENTSLSSIIDTMSEIKNRLSFLLGLEQIIYDKDLNKNFKERKHLHKIIVKETWVFGDEYTYGVDDISLKNVLKAYLKDVLKRDDFEEIIASEDNSDLATIPDVCLWQQYSLGSAGKENLVIELKKPSLNAGMEEYAQIMSYASKVSSDARFPKDKTRWKFYLVTKDVKNELKTLLNQKHRKYGHVSEGDNFDVYILTWGDIITEAKLRHQFIKEKLNLNIQDENTGLDYLRKKYKEYLPNNF